MRKTRWDDYRIAYQVAQSGSLTKAGAVLGMNHATVLRHINQLEDDLGTALFIRHQRGYQLTDAGCMLVDKLPNLIEQFSSLENLLVASQNELQGDLRITTPDDYVPILNPLLKRFREKYPLLKLQLIGTDEILSLAEGAAHVAIRLGPKPTEPDLIVKSMATDLMRYWASDDYIKRYGMLESIEDVNQHLWVMPMGSKTRIPVIRMMLNHLDPERIVYQSNSFLNIFSAISEGIGIGPMGRLQSLRFSNVQPMPFFNEDEKADVWFVYHRDVKHNARVQALYQFLEEELG